MRGWVDVRESTSPILPGALRWRRRAVGRGLLGRATPLRTGRSRCVLISMKLDVMRRRCRSGLSPVAAAGAKKLETSLDVWVVRIKLGSSLVRIHGVGDLIVT